MLCFGAIAWTAPAVTAAENERYQHAAMHMVRPDTLELDRTLEEATDFFRQLREEVETLDRTSTEVDRAAPQQLDCDRVRLSQYEARPFTPIEIRGIPDDIDGPIRLNLLIDGESAGRTLAERTASNTFVMKAPVNPTFSLRAIQVEMQFMDALSDCDAFAFAIQPLEEAPGFFNQVVDDLETKAEMFAVHQDAASADLGAEAIETALYHQRPLIMATRLVQGSEARPPLREALSYASYSDHITPEEWTVIEAIYAAGTTTGTAGRPVLPQGDAFFRDATGHRQILNRARPLLADASSMFGQSPANRARYRPRYATAEHASNSCDTPFYSPTAAELQGYFAAQRAAEQDIEVLDEMGTWIENAQVALLAVGAFMGPKGAAGSRAAAVSLTNAMGLHTTLISAMNEMMHAVYPSELGGLRVEHDGPYAFWEDNEVMDVTWTAAEINAYSQRFDFSQVAADVTWAIGGGKAIESLFRRVPIQDKWKSDLSEEATGVGAGNLIPDIESQAFQIPACTFGPVDVTDEPWTISRPGTLGREVVERIAHQEFNVIREGRGRATVCVAAELVEPGSSGCLAAVPFQDIDVNTEAIDVRIATASGATARTSMQVSPGEAVDLRGRVRYANNEKLQWSVDTPGHMVTPIDNLGHAATVQTSNNEDDFPVTVTAESISTTGLRARPDSPRRYDWMVINAEEENETFSCLNEFEIAMTELDQCSFVAYVDGTLPGSGRRAPAHPISECVTGTIQSWQSNDHGMQHLELRGTFDDGTMQTTLRFDDPGAHTLETTDFGMYGRLMKAIEEPIRSPTGGAAGTRKQPRLSEALELQTGMLTVYPLAGMPSFFGGRFEAHLVPIGRSGRLQGTSYDVQGMLMGGPRCR